MAVIDAANQANIEDIRIAQPVAVAGGEAGESPVTPVTPKGAGTTRTIEDK